MTDTKPPTRIWAAKEYNADDWEAGTFYAVDDGGVEYVRADVVDRIKEKLEKAIYELGGAAEELDDYSPLTGNTIETYASRQIRNKIAQLKEDAQ